MSLYLGIDASTQGIKAEIIDIGKGVIAGSFAVNFGNDLPQYKSPNGFIPNSDPLIKHADPLMWLDGMEMLFDKIQASGVDTGKILGISGSGQQHGSVYLKRLPGAFDSGKSLAEQVGPMLSRRHSPIWMDRSTGEECKDLSGRFDNYVREVTGSPPIERFTGPQIRRFAKQYPADYTNTRVIHLVSSFLCSVLCGANAPIDYGDGAGMNLLNLQSMQWDPEITGFTAPDLKGKLPEPCPGNRIAGHLTPYFAKYGFKAGIPVVAWSGDNPSSLIGVGAGEPGVAVISLGTSDTFFAAMPDYKTDPDGFGHVFGNPQGGFMSLICFTNGSLAREKIKNDCGVNWQEFDNCIENTKTGNDGKLMLPYFEPESTPLVLAPQVWYNFDYATASNAEKIRAVLESQALSMKLHSAWQDEDFKRIRITGGASQSRGLRRILADVFQAQIETVAVTNSAGLGAAIRAANAVAGIPFAELYQTFCETVEKVDPNPTTAPVYQELAIKYSKLEKQV